MYSVFFKWVTYHCTSSMVCLVRPDHNLIRQVAVIEFGHTSNNRYASFQSNFRQSNASQHSVSLYSAGWLYDYAFVGHPFNPLGGGCFINHAPFRGGWEAIGTF